MNAIKRRMIWSEKPVPIPDQVRDRLFRDHALRNDIRGELVFDGVDAVAQVKLALFQSLDLKDVGTRGAFQRSDGGIKVAVFLQHARKLGPELAFFLRCHLALRFHRPPAALTAAETPTSIAR